MTINLNKQIWGGWSPLTPYSHSNRSSLLWRLVVKRIFTKIAKTSQRHKKHDYFLLFLLLAESFYPDSYQESATVGRTWKTLADIVKQTNCTY